MVFANKCMDVLEDGVSHTKNTSGEWHIFSVTGEESHKLHLPIGTIAMIFLGGEFLGALLRVQI